MNFYSFGSIPLSSKRCMRLLIAVFILLSSPQVFGLTLSEVTQLAIENSQSLKAQEMEQHALQFEEKRAGKWHNPQIMSQIGSVQTGGTKGSTLEVSITQALPLSNKFGLKNEIAQIATSAQKYQHQYFKNWVSHQAILSAWKMYVANELLKHGHERAKRFGIVKKYLQTRPRVSIKQRVELSVITSQLLQMERMHEEKKRDLELAKNEMEYWIGKRLSPEELPLTIPEKFNRFTASQVEVSEDLDLRISKIQLKAAALDDELAKKERRPDLFFGGGYRVEDTGQANEFQYLIVGINIPIWDTGRLRTQTTHARLLRDQRQAEEMRRKAELKQKNQLAQIQQAVFQLDRFPKSFIAKNEYVIGEAEKGFRQGVLDVNTFLLSETQAHEIIDQVFISWLDYLENVSLLQLMKGESFNWDVKP